MTMQFARTHTRTLCLVVMQRGEWRVYEAHTGACMYRRLSSSSSSSSSPLSSSSSSLHSLLVTQCSDAVSVNVVVCGRSQGATSVWRLADGVACTHTSATVTASSSSLPSASSRVHKGTVCALAMSIRRKHDSNGYDDDDERDRFVSGSDDGTICVWKLSDVVPSLAERQFVAHLKIITQALCCMAFRLR